MNESGKRNDKQFPDCEGKERKEGHEGSVASSLRVSKTARDGG